MVLLYTVDLIIFIIWFDDLFRR